jgi:hypothetical protein
MSLNGLVYHKTQHKTTYQKNWLFDVLKNIFKPHPDYSLTHLLVVA